MQEMNKLIEDLKKLIDFKVDQLESYSKELKFKYFCNDYNKGTVLTLIGELSVKCGELGFYNLQSLLWEVDGPIARLEQENRNLRHKEETIHELTEAQTKNINWEVQYKNLENALKSLLSQYMRGKE